MLSTVHDNGCVLLCLMDVAERRTLIITLAEIMDSWISYLLHNHPCTLTPHTFSPSKHSCARSGVPFSINPKPRRGFPASLVSSLPNVLFCFSGSIAWLQPLSSLSEALLYCKAQRSPHFPL